MLWEEWETKIRGKKIDLNFMCEGIQLMMHGDLDIMFIIEMNLRKVTDWQFLTISSLRFW